MAIFLLLGPIRDIHTNIITLVEYTKAQENEADNEQVVQFKHNLYHVLGKFICNGHLQNLNRYYFL